MTPEQRAEALRLADLLDGKGNAMIPLPMDRIAALLRELAAVPAEPKPKTCRYKEGRVCGKPGACLSPFCHT